MGSIIKKNFDAVFINNTWVKPELSEIVDIVNPATEKSFATAPMSGIAECDQAINHARLTFDEGTWRNLPQYQRIDYMQKFIDAIEEHEDEIVDLIVSETGHSHAISQHTHFHAAIEIVKHQIAISAQDSTESTPIFITPNPLDGGMTKNASGSCVIRKPIGVVVAIVPYNAPFMLSIVKIIPAMLMGNTVILKAAEQTPLESLILGEIAQSIGLPAGVLNIITGRSEVGEHLTKSEYVDVVSFTGSDAIGSKVMAQAAQNLKKVLLELGGKSPSVVLKDANVSDAALFGASSITLMSGQGCALCTRHIVHNSLIEDYIEAFKRFLWGMPIGNPVNRYNVMGPLINENQLRKVEQYVADAVAEGAEILCGGKRPEYLSTGFYYEPTLITGAANTSKICQEEIFGPVAIIIGFDTEDEALSLANATSYGLSSAVFTNNKGKAFEFASKLETGQTLINGSRVALDPRGPFGGIKRSGFGKEWGREGLNEFTYQQTLVYPVG